LLINIDKMRSLLCLVLFCFIQACTYLPEESNLNLNVAQQFYKIEEDTDFIYLRSNTPISGSNHLVFYPGGLVDPHAYVDLMANFVGVNLNVIIVKSDANLAILDQNAAKEVIDNILSTPPITPIPVKQNIILAGHSLGGSVSCFLLEEITEIVDGLILFASYPAESSDLSAFEGRVLSITGSEDKVLDIVTYNNAKPLLPEGVNINELNNMPSNIEANSTVFYTIEGANHAGFGNYGDQAGDGTRTITLEEQYRQVFQVVESFYNASGW